jgi:hypothetical protein
LLRFFVGHIYDLARTIRQMIRYVNGAVARAVGLRHTICTIL